MESKSVVTVSRKWNEPKIIVWVNNEGIGMGMSMDDYLVALSEVIGNPLFVLTKAQMLQKIREASPAVEAEMKDATLKVAF